MARVLFYVIVFIVGLAIDSKFYNREFTSLHGQELGLAIIGLGLIIVGTLFLAFGSYGRKQKQIKKA